MSRVTWGQIAVVGSAAAAIVAFFIYGGSTLGFPTSFQSKYVALMPGLAVFAVGAVLVATVRGGLLVIGFAGLGMGLAVLVDEMNTISLLIPDLLTSSFTLQDMQLTLIVIGFLVGAIFAATTR